ncbi:hypothetical protein GCM10010329_82590 [Streptomyces spiroverticillatus]|nr:hypothetical protein GCM10010329_82590 [Streptomyces spiroverticillatus]
MPARTAPALAILRSVVHVMRYFSSLRLRGGRSSRRRTRTLYASGAPPSPGGLRPGTVAPRPQTCGYCFLNERIW